MTDERFNELVKILSAEKKAYLAANPNYEPDTDFYNAHNCTTFMDESGCCAWCGAIVDYDLFELNADID